MNLAKLALLALALKARKKDFDRLNKSIVKSICFISVKGCDLCLSGDSQCSSFHKRCEKNGNGDFCQTSASCGEGFGFSDADRCGACIPLSECLGCPDHSIGTCDCEKCPESINDVFGIRAESECSVGPDQECSTEYGHCQGRDFRHIDV